MGSIFPSTYFQNISVGTFTKALGFIDLYVNYIALLILITTFVFLSWLFLKDQDV